MTKPAINRVQKKFTYIESEIVTVTTAITLDDIAADDPHCFVGVQFFSDSLGETSATPTVGSIDIAIQTVNTKPVFEALSDSKIYASAPVTLSWCANTEKVRATPSVAIEGATHWRIVVTCNGS